MYMIDNHPKNTCRDFFPMLTVTGAPLPPPQHQLRRRVTPDVTRQVSDLIQIRHLPPDRTCGGDLEEGIR
jgi:hypothetical protein